MNGWINIFYGSVASAALLLSALGVVFSIITPGVDRWSKRYFLTYFTTLMLACLFSILDLIHGYFSITVGTGYIFVMGFESLFISLPLPMLTAYLLHGAGETIRGNGLVRATHGLWAVFFVQLVCAAFIAPYSSITPDGQYSRGALYPLLVAPLFAIQLLNIAGAIRRRNRLSRKIFIGYLIATLPLGLAMFVHLFVEVFPLIDIGIVVSALSMYGAILSDQVDRDIAQQREIADQRASIIVLQMRPHFIYNTLASVYSLCRQDPEKARQVIMDFTAYLRRNFTAIASAEPIPFTAELEHTRAYLAVEQAQYEDGLIVDYDTPHTQFRVPPLTLQPLVENAVKHGRDPYAGVFHISVRTRETDSGSEIVVTDDGRGYDPDGDSEPGIALSNIRQRLESMCGGTLDIRQRETGGTQVTIFVPRR